MGKVAEQLQLIKDFVGKKSEYFYLLDFGHFSIKVAFLELNKHTKELNILEITEEIHPRHKGIAGDVIDIEYFTLTAKRALKKLKNPRAKSKVKNLLIGVASEIIYGQNFSYISKRENPDIKIDMREFKNVVHNAEIKAYEDIRKKFVMKSGYKETDVSLINYKIQEIRVDGYRVPNPIDFSGEELFVSIFNAYLPIFYKKLFEDTANQLGFNFLGLVYEPYAVFSAMIKIYGKDFEGIIIDIGCKTTRVSLVRKGRLEEVKAFSFGGESFTQKIASHFTIGFWEAENIKIRYSQNKLSESAKLVIEELLRNELSIFLSGLEMILSDFSRANLLPGDIFLHGGGGDMPLIDAIIRKRNWKKDLSFLNSPKIYRLNLKIFKNITVSNSSITEAQIISLLGLADDLLNSLTQQSTLFDKTLNRVVKLIQG